MRIYPVEKKDILLALVNHYSDGNKAQFAAKLGVTPQTISTWISRNTFDIDKIFAYCEGVSAEWLLTGKGELLRVNSIEITKQESIEDKLLAIIRGKDDIIVQQAAKIGRLENEVEHLKRVELGRQDAGGVGAAGVG